MKYNIIMWQTYEVIIIIITIMMHKNNNSSSNNNDDEMIYPNIDTFSCVHWIVSKLQCYISNTHIHKQTLCSLCIRLLPCDVRKSLPEELCILSYYLLFLPNRHRRSQHTYHHRKRLQTRFHQKLHVLKGHIQKSYWFY